MCIRPWRQCDQRSDYTFLVRLTLSVQEYRTEVMLQNVAVDSIEIVKARQLNDVRLNKFETIVSTFVGRMWATGFDRIDSAPV